MAYYLSVDLGGTSLRLALLDSQAEILARKTISSLQVQAPEQLVKVLVREIRALQKIKKIKETQIRGLALGIPGLVNIKEGKVYQSPHFPQWKDFPLVPLLKPQIKMPVFIENDANQAALAEAHWGAGRNWPDFIMLTLGTGIGGAIIYQKKIFHGSEGFAGEFGHMVIHPGGNQGAIKIRGTLESYCSMTGLRIEIPKHIKKTQFKKQPSSLKKLNLNDPDFPRYLQAMALQSDVEALKIWHGFGKNLAYGLANLTHNLGIFRFVIGGGLAAAWDLFIPSCQQKIKKLVYPSTYPLIQISPASLGVDAGLKGGVLVIRQTS